jgi:GTP cyclohydrolase FolE2
MNDLDFEQEVELDAEAIRFARETTVTQKERERANLAMDVEAFLKNGGKVQIIKTGQNSDLFGLDPTKEELQALEARYNNVVKITFCPVEKEYRVKRGRRTAYFCTEYAMTKYIKENFRLSH